VAEEDLLKPKILPLMLNARGRNPPALFAGLDFEAMHLGLVTRNISPVFLNCYTMVMDGNGEPHEYFKLMSWDDHPDAFMWLHTRKQYLPGEALAILESQERLLRFLVYCCKQILSGIPPEDLTGPSFPIQPEPSLKAEIESTGSESLAVMAAEAPYRPPAKLDFDRIESVLGARLAAAQDHVWVLREDPSYFLEELIEVKEHRQELLKDTLGGIHPTLKSTRQDKFWARICGTVAIEAYMQLESFAELHEQSQALRRLHDKYVSILSPMEDLPDELQNTLLRFRHYLNQTAKGLLAVLREGVAASPPWRSYFVRLPPSDPSSPMINVRNKRGANMDTIETQLLWLLRTLWEDNQDLFFIRLPLAVDELGRLLETEPRARDLLTARLAGTIGDLAIVSQCISQLDLFLPWARTFEGAMVEKESSIKKEFEERTRVWGEVMAALHEKNMTRVAKLGDPSGNRFGYPIDKRRTKQNVELLRRAEQNLDDFWAAIDGVVYSKSGSLEGSAHSRVLSQKRTMRRTPEWVEPAPSTVKPGREAVVDPELADLYKPLSTIYISHPTENRSTTAMPTSKEKTKTRGTGGHVDAPPPATVMAEELNPPLITIIVDHRSFKVFRTLFFNPAVTSSPGEVLWNDFLHAMTSTGLFAAEKLYGSVWQFQRLEGDQSRIQFHEPHPRGRIPFMTARRHGRRLNRAFGWTGNTFVLKQK
jgi:hypothetical protein